MKRKSAKKVIDTQKEQIGTLVKIRKVRNSNTRLALIMDNNQETYETNIENIMLLEDINKLKRKFELAMIIVEDQENVSSYAAEIKRSIDKV